MTWRQHAACRGMSPGIFHPLTNHGKDARKARSTCADCPVTDDCLTEALADPEALGIRAGLTEAERDTIRRNRRAHPATRMQWCHHCDRYISTTCPHSTA